MFCSEKFTLVMLVGVREVEVVSFLFLGYCFKRIKFLVFKREEGRGGEREFGLRGILVEIWERNGLGGN